MAYDQIDLFMAAIRRLESGSYNGNYTARGPTITNRNSAYYGDHAYGAYQIMTRNWASWSREAGVGGAPITSIAAQNKVARYKFTQYYNRYKDWALVAIAWFGGGGTADKAARNGISSVAGLSDQLGTSVPTYARKIIGYMQDAPAQYQNASLGAPSAASLDPGGGNIPQPAPSPVFGSDYFNQPALTAVEFDDEYTPQQALRGILAGMANQVAGGQRSSLAEAATQVNTVDPELDPLPGEEPR